MALQADKLTDLIERYLNEQGIVTTGQHAQGKKIAIAVGKAVVEHIQADAMVTVSGGSSAGNYKVT